MKHSIINTFQEFRCLHCQVLVHINHRYAGVNNRNHCPYCLWSRHLDEFKAGDRMSACKAAMKPIGLTLKESHNKYRSNSGELMLVHLCQDCGRVIINRIAADDYPPTIMQVFQESTKVNQHYQDVFHEQGIHLLQADHAYLVHKRLYGRCEYSEKELLFS
jgi:hypothetical protein